MPHRIHKCTDTLYDYAKIINTYVSSMYELRNVLESKFVETWTSFYKKKIIYRATVSQRLRNPALDSCLSERTGPSFILSFETEENYKPGVRIADLKLNTGTPE